MPARQPRFAKLRRHIADWVLGGQTVLFVSEDQAKLLEQQRFLDLDDDSLGKQFRRWVQMFSEFTAARATDENMSFRFAMASHSVLFLSTELRRRNAESAEFVIRGTVDGGKTEGCYRVRVDQVADDYEFGHEAVEITHAPGEPDKITKMVLREQNPGYDAWLAGRTGDAASAQQAA
jgi:hypothetical protein